MDFRNNIIIDHTRFTEVGPLHKTESEAEEYANQWRVKKGGIAVVREWDDKKTNLKGFVVYAYGYK